MNTDVNSTVVVCIALLAILLFLLGANVTRHRAIRGSAGDQTPTDPSDRLLIAIRTHGNAAEYVPTLIVLLLVCAILTDGWWLQALAVASVLARVTHALGMLRSSTLATHGPARDLGAGLTYLTGIALGVTAIAAI